MKAVQALIVAAGLLFGVTVVQADIIITADPGYPAGADFLTLNPELYAPAERNVTQTRELRQTFQLDATIEVAQLVTGLEIQAGVNGGLILSIYEVEDTNAGTWTPGNLVHSFTIPTTETLPNSLTTLGFTFTGADIFTLPQRNTGTQGYGLAVSNADGLTNVGAWHHSNDGTDYYTAGIYYSEGGTPPQPYRDMGIALVAVPEPSVAMLLLGGLGILSLTRRRR